MREFVPNGEARIEVWGCVTGNFRKKGVYPARVTAKRVAVYDGFHTYDRITGHTVSRKEGWSVYREILVAYRIANGPWIELPRD